jgi:hypothetical protein
MVDQEILEHQAAEGPADDRTPRLSQYECRSAQTKSASGHYPGLEERGLEYILGVRERSSKERRRVEGPQAEHSARHSPTQASGERARGQGGVGRSPGLAASALTTIEFWQ